MDARLTDEQRKEYLKILNAADPYPDDAPELNTFDGDVDIDRMRATIARDLLRMDEEEQKKETKG